jgi:hypothetical protein
MAHFAQIDENNVVTQVIVVNNNDCLNADGVEDETVGAAFCANLFGGTWKQTSYNANFRKNYAGVGYSYIPHPIDGFAPPKPYASWNLDTDTCRWVPPVPSPTDDKRYFWDEPTLSWVEVEGM